MKQASLSTKISVGFLLALLLLVGISVLTYRDTRALIETNQRATHTHRVLATLEQLLSEMKDTETGQRGYLITGEEQYLEPYRAALGDMRHTLRELQHFTADNPRQQQQLAALEPLIGQKLAELQGTIDLRKNVGFAAAAQVVRTDRGKQLMDNVRAAAREMAKVEQALLRQQVQEAETNAHSSLLAIAYGNILAFVLVALAGYTVNRDLTKRQQAEHALAAVNAELEQRVEERTAKLQRSQEAERTQREFFQVTLASIGDAVIVTNPQGEVTFLNRVAEVVTGWTTADAVGKPLPEVFHILNEETRQPVESPVSKVLRTGGIAGLANHTVLIRKDGSACPIDDSAAPIRDEQGQLLGIILVFRDVTERRQAEKELARHAAALQRSNEALQQFAHIVSHDLQEPLRTMSSFATLLARRYQGKLEAEAGEFIALIVEGATRMQELVRDLLAYTRVDGSAPAWTPVDCEDLLVCTVRDLRATIADTFAEVTHNPLPTVWGEAKHLGLVFQNLIGNALKFRSAAPPRIHVSARQEGARWLLSVRDNGIGLAPQHAERIFQVFQRLHPRSEYPGTGIGLAICKKVVERHGGGIWVESGQGQGATFFFTLPAL